jgi:hypothetical protein
VQIWCQIQHKTSSLRYLNCVPDIYNVYTASHIQTSVFNWKHLRCYWRYLDNSTSVILQTWCQIQRICSCLRYVNCCPGRIQCNYSSAYLGFNIQLNVSALLLDASRQFNARHTTNLMPNIAHILGFALCELWSGPLTIKLQLRLLMLHYWADRIFAAIGDISTFGCALYCNLDAKYNAHPSVYAMRTVVPHIYNAFTVPHIHTSIFIWTYLCCYWRYFAISMRVIIQIWC